MKPDNYKSKKWVGVFATLYLCATLNSPAGGGGGGGGFFGGGGGGGGFFGGGGGGQRGNAQQYTPAGQVGNASISINDSGQLIVVADEDTLAKIKAAVAAMDKPKPQVLIKVVFLEVQHNNSLDIGLEGAWGRNLGSTNNPLNTALANAFGASPVGTFLGTNLNSVGQPIGAFAPIPPGAGLYTLLGNDFQATLRAIATAGKAQLLSRPSIVARDRQPAMIQVGQRVPLLGTSTISALGTQSTSIDYVDVGIILRVTPFITPDGMVQMILSPETSAIDPTLSLTVAPGVTQPVINRRIADTVAITPDGQTVVIGGLIANDKTGNESKIPFLGDIPLIGNLFKRQTKTGTKRELLIFLTPHILRAPQQLAALSDKEQNEHILIKKSVSEEELDRFLERVPIKKD